MASTVRRAGLLRELSRPRNIVVGAQMLFVAFSGLVLVPVLMLMLKPTLLGSRTACVVRPLWRQSRRSWPSFRVVSTPVLRPS